MSCTEMQNKPKNRFYARTFLPPGALTLPVKDKNWRLGLIWRRCGGLTGGAVAGNGLVSASATESKSLSKTRAKTSLSSPARLPPSLPPSLSLLSLSSHPSTRVTDSGTTVNYQSASLLLLLLLLPLLLLPLSPSPPLCSSLFRSYTSRLHSITRGGGERKGMKREKKKKDNCVRDCV